MTRHLIGGMVLATLLAVLWKSAPPALYALRRDPPTSTRPAPGEPQQPRTQPQPVALSATRGPVLRVLFVGNSHTYYNDMPQMIGELARSAKQARSFEFEMIVAGGATLEDHLAAGTVPDRLNRGHWDWVVLQEQQQRPTWTFNRAQVERQFNTPARTLDVMARAAGAKTLLYMPWARRTGDPDNVPNDDYEHMQARSLESHTRLARELDVSLAQVGSAWKWVHEQRPDLPLWLPDQMHPTRHGSFLAACVLYAVLYESSPLDIPYDAELPAQDAALLRRAAVVARHL